MQKKPVATYVIAFCAGASFILGLTFPNSIGAQGGLPEAVARAPFGAGGGLEPYNTYGKVMSDLKGLCYDELPADDELTYAAIRGMLKSVDDPYTRFLEPKEYKALADENEGEFVGIGAVLEGTPTKEGFVRINRPLSNTPAQRAGVQKGDLITKVDGKEVNGLTVDQVVQLIRGAPDTPVRLTIQRGGKPEPIEVRIIRQRVEVEVVQDIKLEEGNIGYVYLTQFNQRSDEKLEQAIADLRQRGARGLILDLRGNPGGLLDSAIDIVSRFVPPGSNAVIIVESGGQQQVKRANPRKYLGLGPNFPIAVLVNHSSASASEIVAGALKDYGVATVVGETTFGKGLVQTVFPRTQDGSAVMITTHKYLTAKGHDINRSRDRRGGVAPDMAVEISDEDFAASPPRDTQLEKARQLLWQKVGYVKPPAGPATSANSPTR